MKKSISVFLVLVMMLSCMLVAGPSAFASTKAEKSKAIAIVFDNSGSMYLGSNSKAWCRATYAMEVFASMLDKGDTLYIYPMHPIEVGGKQYTMNDPYKVTSYAQASAIREIYTPAAGGTPIESVDCAIQGLQTVSADQKYMIVLTDGEAFYKNESEMSKSETKKQLDMRFKEYAGKAMTVMYLGIGSNSVMPDTPNSDSFVKKQAGQSADVLSALTEMCNLIFGRDSLPKKMITGKSIEFDISMNKLIAFVQGENISNLSITGPNGVIGEKIGETSTKFGKKGSNRGHETDDSLQGMIVTYADCSAGKYTINYTGTATSVEIYYEPNADLDFVFTDSQGNNINHESLYEGDYKVSFGMKDGKTGKLIESELLGAPHYRGSYIINGKEYPIVHDGYSSEVPVSLKMNDTFEAKLTVTYLSGYTIDKTSSDFGWQFGGIKIKPRPAGDLKLVISGGEDKCLLQNLNNSTPYTVKVYYQGKQLTGDALKNVELSWNPDSSNANIRKEFAGDHYKLSLGYKNPANPQSTVLGKCTVAVQASYTPEGSEKSHTTSELSYNIVQGELMLEITGGSDSYSLLDLSSGTPYTAKVYYEGKQLVGEALQRVELKWNPETSNAEVKKEFADDHYILTLHYKDPANPQNTVCGECSVNIYAVYSPENGNIAEADDMLTYNIADTSFSLSTDIVMNEHYIVIPELDKSSAITVNVLLNGSKLTPEDFDRLELYTDCGKIKYEVTPNRNDSSYSIKLKSTEGIPEGGYPILVKVCYTDKIGRTVQTEETESVTLGNMPLWLKWLLILLLLILIIVIIYIILHIRVIPKYAHADKRDRTMIFDGEDQTKSTGFSAKIEKGRMTVFSKYAGIKTGVTMDVRPGRESYLKNPHTRRSAEVKSSSVKKFGNATINEITINGVKYILNEENFKLERMPKNDKPFLLKHGTTVSYSGTMLNGGSPKPFSVNMKLNFKNK